jgi:hypothetical protein
MIITYRIVHSKSIKTSDSRSIITVPTTFDIELHQLNLYPPTTIYFCDIPQRSIEEMYILPFLLRIQLDRTLISHDAGIIRQAHFCENLIAESAHRISAFHQEEVLYTRKMLHHLTFLQQQPSKALLRG